jgi:hypothetical protein
MASTTLPPGTKVTTERECVAGPFKAWRITFDTEGSNPKMGNCFELGVIEVLWFGALSKVIDDLTRTLRAELSRGGPLGIRVAFTGFGASPEFVANAADGANQLDLGAFINLLTQVIHVNVDDVGHGIR